MNVNSFHICFLLALCWMQVKRPCPGAWGESTCLRKGLVLWLAEDIVLQCESMATAASAQGDTKRWPSNVLEVCTSICCLHTESAHRSRQCSAGLRTGWAAVIPAVSLTDIELPNFWVYFSASRWNNLSDMPIAGTGWAEHTPTSLLQLFCDAASMFFTFLFDCKALLFKVCSGVGDQLDPHGQARQRAQVAQACCEPVPMRCRVLVCNRQAFGG